MTCGHFVRISALKKNALSMIVNRKSYLYFQNEAAFLIMFHAQS